MTDITINMPTSLEESDIQYLIETYRAWIRTLAGYMELATELLENLYAQQDETIAHLRTLCAKTLSVRRVDFDAILGKVVGGRSESRQCLSELVNRYRAGREAVILEVREMFLAGGLDVREVVNAWPALKQRLLSETDDGVEKIVAALRQVHMEQENISTALRALLTRGEKLKIDDLKTVAQRLASRDSRDSVELAALLAVCESASHNAGLTWQRLAG